MNLLVQEAQSSGFLACLDQQTEGLSGHRDVVSQNERVKEMICFSSLYSHQKLFTKI